MMYSLDIVFSMLGFYTYTISCKIACDLDEYWLAMVDANALLALPALMH